MDVDDLIAVEEIRRLKARYFRLLDHKEWDAMGELFTEDARLQYGPEEGQASVGRAAIVASSRSALQRAITVHQGHMGEIEVTGPDRATGAWAVLGYTDSPEGFTDDFATPRADGGEQRFRKQGYGYHFDEYRREADGRWRISAVRVSVLRSDRLP